MKYKVGMFGGSFDPLHIGHIHDIIRAASECEELYVMISWCDGRESISKELRYRWIYNSTKHLPNVKIILIEDKAISKEEYNTDYYWENGAKDIKNAIGKKIDVVYCGTDYLGTNRFESLYCPESKVVYFDRKEVPISSTEIRKWAWGNWDYVPLVCRPYYCAKVLIIGSESTGKSTLVQNLALAYNTNYVEEVGRYVCEEAGGEEYMDVNDLVKNLLLQKANEMEAIKQSNRILFVDTDALITKFYSHFLLKDDYQRYKCDELADSIADFHNFDLILFLEPTNEFIQDGTRSEEIRSDRERYSKIIKSLFDETSGLKYHCLSGNYLENFNEAKNIIKEKLGIYTTW